VPSPLRQYRLLSCEVKRILSSKKFAQLVISPPASNVHLPLRESTEAGFGFRRSEKSIVRSSPPDGDLSREDRGISQGVPQCSLGAALGSPVLFDPSSHTVVVSIQRARPIADTVRRGTDSSVRTDRKGWPCHVIEVREPPVYPPETTRNNDY
jgi:hypothetical protein